MSDPTLPDGIGAEHIEPHHARRRPALLSLVVLALLVAVGLSGLAGGRMQLAEWRSDAGTFTLRFPPVIRNGEFLETRFGVRAARRIERLVIGIEPALWRQVTTNSTVPQAGEETFDGGLIRFAFGAVDAGGAFDFQVAQQINPSLGGLNRGRVVFLDGERVLAEGTVSMRILP